MTIPLRLVGPLTEPLIVPPVQMIVVLLATSLNNVPSVPLKAMGEEAVAPTATFV
jgi:hypothetical protein